jgi:hypothetical protein
MSAILAAVQLSRVSIVSQGDSTANTVIAVAVHAVHVPHVPIFTGLTHDDLNIMNWSLDDTFVQLSCHMDDVKRTGIASWVFVPRHNDPMNLVDYWEDTLDRTARDEKALNVWQRI